MKKFRSLAFLFCIVISFQPVFGQRIIPKFIRKMYFEKDTSKRGSFVILPVLSSAPETGIEAGGAGLYSFYTDTIHRETRVSNIFAYATITTKGQNRINLSSTYWSPQNKYTYFAQIGRIDFPMNFYGIGNNTAKANEDYLEQKRYRLNLSAQKNLGGNVYLGLVAGAYKYDFANDNATGIFNTDIPAADRSGGSFVYVGPIVSFDNRNNNTYTTKGIVVHAQYNLMQGVFSNNSYQGGFLNIEYAQFFALTNKLVLGVNVQEQSLTGGRSPFYLLPLMGNDEIMRGYYEGRYRDRNLMVGQAELRYRISPRLGLAAFGGAGEVFRSSFTLAQLKPNFGGGARYFFDIEKGLALRVDYGFGQKPTGEQRLSGLYVALGQAF
jgi:hypothetical protein